MKKPLVVDLDGTLIKTDILVETLLKYFKLNIFNIFRFLIIVFRGGKSAIKSEIARSVDIDVSILPYNEDVLAYIRSQKSEGRKVVLATATNEKYANQIAKYLDIFDDVFSSDEKTNLASSVKAEKLVSIYGAKGFDYVGNSMADIKVWKASDQSIVVNPDKGVLPKAEQCCNVVHIIENRPNFFRPW
ncbi:NIF family HAD-type phosphatase [Vibrio hannami]|uniref:NIF family HAD-type phosphatase n=1 Tax=Vibrio hannami TaxID=2717094 RepID=UPI00240EF4CB|nr:NIF family HAD-type phosphatase [Vibrio hannami]MDG3086931.1 NIF family HAD-type phosphatase [Vibrio hannami]